MSDDFVGITRRYESKSKWSDIARHIHVDSSDYLSIGDSVTDKLKDGREFTVEVAAIDPYDTNEIAFVFKDIIETHRMNAEDTNVGGWRDSEMRRWLNDEFFNLLPDDLQKVIKTRLIWQKQGDNVLESEDNLWLPSEVEIFGKSIYSNSDEDDVQFELFKDPRNRVKSYEDTSALWWERSPIYSNSNYFCRVYSSGSAYYNYASYSYGVAPAFLI